MAVERQTPGEVQRMYGEARQIVMRIDHQLMTANLQHIVQGQPEARPDTQMHIRPTLAIRPFPIRDDLLGLYLVATLHAVVVLGVQEHVEMRRSVRADAELWPQFLRRSFQR
jgi:hypothetical protein